MSIFSRTRDIIAANVAEILDRADDPAKMVRMIIMEMEETLVEVRASAAMTIADQKELSRHIRKLNTLEADWQEKAELALSKDRDDLAKAALIEKRKASEMKTQLETEVGTLEEALRASDADIEKLQKKLADARSRQNTINARLESANSRVKLRTMHSGERVKDALGRFDDLERQVDEAEGRADSMTMGQGGPSLEDEIDALKDDDGIAAELAAMKAALKKNTDSKAKKGE